MSKFIDTMKSDPPRMVVLFRYGSNGNEEFQWGVVSSIPILTLIGHIKRVQVELIEAAPIMACDQQALVITWDVKARQFWDFVHPDIPVDPLVGMLETIKGALVDSRLAQQAAAQRTRIVGPDGQPVRT